ncbi:motility associated factor glycosyltransferase family protein [Clostridium diolis]|uniref:motility associated factor glycosyltransferase family protein n=1 Tax=Clostridium diolis TaxID=223919 RepID=UPI003AF52A5D
MADTYRKNLRCLKNMSNEVYNRVNNLNIKSVSICKSKNNQLNLVKRFENREIYINSTYNPSEQAKYIAEYALKDDNNIVFIFGLGMAYEIKEMIKKDRNKKYIICEPDMEIFKVMLNYVELESFFNGNNDISLLLYSNSAEIVDNFKAIIKNEDNLNIKFINLPSYAICYKDLINEVQLKIGEFIKITSNNVFTSLFFYNKWYENFITNISNFSETTNIEELFGKFKNIPGIVIGAGPSLKYNLEILRSIGNKAILAAAGSGISTLDSHDIRAHMWGAVDGNETEGRIVEDLKVNKELMLMYSLIVHPSVFECKSFTRKFLLCNNVDDVYFKTRKDKSLNTLYSGSSITNVVAYNLAAMGCNPIIFLGQDCCYSRGKNYAEGSKFYIENSEDSGTIARLNENGEEINEEKDKLMKVLNRNGEEVYTDKGFLTIKIAMEDVIKRFPNTRFLNGTQDGLNIEGAENIDFNKYCTENIFNNKEYNFNEIVKEIYLNNKENDNSTLVMFKTDLNDITKKLQVLVGFLGEEEKSESIDIGKIKSFVEIKEKELMAISYYSIVMMFKFSFIKHIYGNKSEFDKIKYKYLTLLNTCNFLNNTMKQMGILEEN